MEKDMTVGEAYDKKHGRKVGKPKKKKKKGAGIMDYIKAPFKKIEAAMEERTGSESMRKKHKRRKKK